MDKKELEIILSKLKPTPSYKKRLEQYPTPPDIAASILWVAQKDIVNKVVADFGTGNGIFAIGSALLGAKKVYAIEKDEASIDVAKENAKQLGLEIEFLNQDVQAFNKKVDTVVMNPPFGTRRTHKDREFLIKAMSIADVIYSIHKLESEKFIASLSEDHGFKHEMILEFDFTIKQIMPFHKKPKYKVRCGCWRLERLPE